MEMFTQTLYGAAGLGELALRFTVAAVLAGLIGFNREWRRKPAGLRTHILVGVAACAFALLSLELFAEAASLYPESQTDPIRVVEAVIKGVAFLGAGVIIQARGTVTGVTTGASIWVAGAIGLAAGVGNMRIALLCAGFGLIALIALRWLEAATTKADRDDHGAKGKADDTID